MVANVGLIAFACLLVGLALAWGAAAWWFGRQLKAAAHRMHKLEKSREMLDQQNAQARRQAEQLQLETGELRQALARLDAAQAQELRAQAVHRAAASNSLFLDSGSDIDARDDEAHGFAETQILQPAAKR